MVIFEGKYLNHEWTVGVIPGTLYGMSGEGWTDQELFLHWLRHFLKYANPGGPLLLLLDGHSSHFELISIELAKERDVTIFCLPPHTTHRSQPLDSCVFGPLKKAWTEVCHTYQQDNPGAVITKYSFSPFFAKAWSQSFSPNNLISGFKKCGVYPFNREAIEVLYDDVAMAVLQVSNDKEQPCLSNNNSSFHNHLLDHQESHNHSSNNEDTDDEITDEMIIKFKRRYEEGYNMDDPIYQQWLEANNLVSSHSTASISTNNSVIDNFSDVPVLSPVAVTDVEITTSNTSSAASNIPGDVTTTSLQHHLHANKNNSAITSNILQQLITQVNPKLLGKSATRAITTARVLTSKECLDIIKEKQMKQKKAEEKLRRKKEREEKKKK